MTGPVLLVAAESRAWRRQLGALAWAALEHLALAAQPDELGWAAPVGVRDVAAGLGVTKDTAARAVASLAAAGLVAFAQVETVEGQRRSGYRLTLPEGIRLRHCPVDQDTPSPSMRSDSSLSDQPTVRCIPNPDSTPDTGCRPHQDSASDVRGARRRSAPSAAAVQPSLFDPVATEAERSGSDQVSPLAPAASTSRTAV